MRFPISPRWWHRLRHPSRGHWKTCNACNRFQRAFVEAVVLSLVEDGRGGVAEAHFSTWDGRIRLTRDIPADQKGIK